MITVGLTGGIGSGKSTVAEMFRELGVPVYDSDEEAKHLMATSEDIKQQIVALFGKEAYLDEELNRKHIASKVFSDRGKLEELNSIIHPAVRTHFIEWRKGQTAPYVVQESALIFESGIQSMYDFVVLVTAPLDIRIKRVMERDDVAMEKVQDRIENQMGDHEKISLADFMVENVDLETTRKKVTELHNTLSKLAQPQF